jgi:2-methylcitrate synthase
VVEFKPKKSVALSGVTAGNTALCSVGKSGNDLHYRGYDILDLAKYCEFLDKESSDKFKSPI